MTFILSSAEGKAKVSETLVAYIAGCIVVFGAFGIWDFAVNTGSRMEEEQKKGVSIIDMNKYCKYCRN